MEKSVTFLNGFKMPLVGLGTWQAKTETELETAFDAALATGYRHIDTAYMYTNESLIGNVLKKWLDSGKISRELFIVTKLPMIGMTPEEAPYFLKKSLESLQLSYVDLYLIHAPFGLQYQDDATRFPMKDGKILLDLSTDLEAIWKSLEKEVDAGRMRSLGISNFCEDQVLRIFSISRHKPMNHQIEMHVYCQQKPLREVCKRLDITVGAYAPVGSPGRKAYYAWKQGITYEPADLFKDPIVKKIGMKYEKTPAQVLLRFLTQQEIAVIPKGTNPSRILQNIQVFDFVLSSEEMGELERLDKGELGRTFVFDNFNGAEEHPEFPFLKK